MQSDGVMQAHVSMLLIDPEQRGSGLGSRLLREGLERAGGQFLDIRTLTEGYYERSARAAPSGFASHARPSASGKQSRARN